MANALIAWFRAPAPTTWTSTTPVCRSTPAMAPGTEFGFDRLDTFRTSWSSPDEPAATLTRSTGGASDPLRFRHVRPISTNVTETREASVERDGLVVGVERVVRHRLLAAEADADLAPDLLVDVEHQLGVLGQERLRVLLALAELLAF